MWAPYTSSSLLQVSSLSFQRNLQPCRPSRATATKTPAQFRSIYHEYSCIRDLLEEIWPDRRIWLKKREKIFVDLVIEETHKMFNTSTGSFSDESWENICQQFNELATVSFHVTEMKRRFAALKKRYDIVKSLYEDYDYCYDPRRNMIDMYDSDWEEVIEVTPELELYRKHGCPLYDQLEFIFRSDREPGEYAQHSCGRKIAPNGSNKRLLSEAPCSGPNKKSCADAEDVPSQTVAQSAAPQTVDLYSVGCCISVINRMQGIDRQLYIDAIDLFKNHPMLAGDFHFSETREALELAEGYAPQDVRTITQKVSIKKVIFSY